MIAPCRAEEFGHFWKQGLYRISCAFSFVSKPAGQYSDPWHFGMDPDPRIRTSEDWIRILLFSSVTFKMATKKINFSMFFCLLLFKAVFRSFFKDKTGFISHKTVGMQVSHYFCLMIEGSGFGSSSVPDTNESGSGRPSKMRILRIRIRIRNTAADSINSIEK